MTTGPKQCKCGRQGYITDSRQVGDYVRRRYECRGCKALWTTKEVRYEAERPDILTDLKNNIADKLIAMAQEIMK